MTSIEPNVTAFSLDLHRTLKRASLALRNKTDALLADEELTAPQAAVLECLWSGEAGCLRDLGQRIGTQPATLTVIVDGLERRGLVRRTADDSDGRIKRIEATEASFELRSRVTTVGTLVQAQAVQGMTRNEIEALGVWLSRLATNLGEGEMAVPLWGAE